MTTEELQDRNNSRQFWERIVILILAAIPNYMNLAMQYKTGDRLVTATQILNKADEDRSRIEEKIDETKETAKVVATEARSAVEKAEVTAEHVKTAVAELKSGMDR